MATGIDYSKIPAADLEFIAKGDWGAVSHNTLTMIANAQAKTPSVSLEATPPATTTPPKDEGLLQHLPESLRGPVRGAAEAVATAAPIAGAVAGGVVGGGTPVPGGAIIGAGLGAGMGEQAANLIRAGMGDRKWEGLPEEASRMGKDVVTGTLGEMGGQVLSRGVQKLGETLAPYAEKLYSFAVNTPITSKWKILYPGAEGTAREMAVKTGLEAEVLPNKYGLRQAQAKAELLTDTITRTVREATKSGQAGNVHARDLVNKGLQDVRGRSVLSSDTKVAKEAVKKIEDEVMAKGGVPGTLSAEDTLALKRQFDSEIKWDEAKPITDIKGLFTQEARKGIREAAENALEATIPELRDLNKKTSAWIDLKEALEHTIARDLSKDMVKFSSKVLALRNIGLAALDTFLGYSTNRARLAFAIKKGAEWRARNTARVGAFAAASSAREKESQPPQVIRYNSQGIRMTE